ncbi:hypothetical protein [Marilutibacter aestuarii]|nr:hypothetical protein [Lysobacter aestuarii]
MLHIIKLIERHSPRHARRIVLVLAAASALMLGAGLALLQSH